MRVKVIGAGFSGLVIAYFLTKKSLGVDIYEKEDRVGGLIETAWSPYGQYEKAAGSFLNSARVEEVSRDINMALIPLSSRGKRKYIYWNGSLTRFPFSIKDTPRILKALYFLISKDDRLIPRAGETVGEWGRRSFGSRMSRVILTALQGIYGNREGAEQLSASLIFKPRLNQPRERRRLKLGRGSVYPIAGMANWTAAIRDWLIHHPSHKGNFFLKQAVHKSHLQATDHVVITIPAHQLAAAGWDELFAPFCNIKYNSLISVVTFRDRKAAQEQKTQLRGFGCLFPSDAGFHSLGILFPEGQFKARARRGVEDKNKAEYLRERWMLSGASEEESNEQVIKKIEHDFNKLYQRTPEFCCWEIVRYARALPRYDLKLEKILQENQTQVGRHYLFGNYTGRIGLTRLLDQAAALAENIYRDIKGLSGSKTTA